MRYTKTKLEQESEKRKNTPPESKRARSREERDTDKAREPVRVDRATIPAYRGGNRRDHETRDIIENEFRKNRKLRTK